MLSDPLDVFADTDGDADLWRAVADLASRLPDELRGLAFLAYNYAWAWQPGVAELFATVDPGRWELCEQNPVRLLQEAPRAVLLRAAQRDGFAAEVQRAAAALVDYLSPTAGSGHLGGDPLVAFFCAEFGVHHSLPLYAGGLGVLAGDVLKEASDQRMPMVGVGLLYRQGYCRQRIDASGWQQEYWVDIDPGRLPAVLVTQRESPLRVSVPIGTREVGAQVWRVDVGRTPLYLLDPDIPDNHPADRLLARRLYVGDRRVRLAQYALLGIGGLRALRALGVEPTVLHLNEGHPALAAVEWSCTAMALGASPERALQMGSERTVFTTHTPVADGNDLFTPDEIEDVLGSYLDQSGLSRHRVLALGHVDTDHEASFAVTALALRTSTRANGVSRRHGEVARQMWSGLGRIDAHPAAPIEYVTNGVHLPTWMSPEMQALLNRYLPRDWFSEAANPAVWEAIEAVPDGELWEVRNQLRRRLIEEVRYRTAGERFGRGMSLADAERAAGVLDENALVVGFARRLASYKRTGLIFQDSDRLARILEPPNPVQVVVAGKAHPDDQAGKQLGQVVFNAEEEHRGRVAFLSDYAMGLASILVAGADVWINVPRPPMEASGTSGMKVALNGGLNLSVLDGWWAEAFDDRNGWSVASHPGTVPDGGEEPSTASGDDLDATDLYRLLDSEVIPLFYRRDADGIPHDWLIRVKHSIRTIAPQFCATRMLHDYASRYSTSHCHHPRVT